MSLFKLYFFFPSLLVYCIWIWHYHKNTWSSFRYQLQTRVWWQDWKQTYIKTFLGSKHPNKHIIKTWLKLLRDDAGLTFPGRFGVRQLILYTFSSAFTCKHLRMNTASLLVGQSLFAFWAWLSAHRGFYTDILWALGQQRSQSDWNVHSTFSVAVKGRAFRHEWLFEVLISQ